MAPSWPDFSTFGHLSLKSETNFHCHMTKIIIPGNSLKSFFSTFRNHRYFQVNTYVCICCMTKRILHNNAFLGIMKLLVAMLGMFIIKLNYLNYKWKTPSTTTPELSSGVSLVKFELLPSPFRSRARLFSTCLFVFLSAWHCFLIFCLFFPSGYYFYWSELFTCCGINQIQSQWFARAWGSCRKQKHGWYTQTKISEQSSRVTLGSHSESDKGECCVIWNRWWAVV